MLTTSTPYNRRLALALALAGGLSLAACGKKPALLKPPEGSKPGMFPRLYPDPALSDPVLPQTNTPPAPAAPTTPNQETTTPPPPFQPPPPQPSVNQLL